jgi:hypothetical protein
MSFNGSGTFVINSTGQPVVTGTVISSTAFNALTADLATGLSTTMTKDGQTTATANIPMGSFKFTGLSAGSAATDSANIAQVQNSFGSFLTVSGTDTITATVSPSLTAYAAGQMFAFVAANTNTGAVTINISSLGAKAITKNGTTALVAGDLTANYLFVIVYDGTQFQVVGVSATTFTNLTISGVLTLSGAGTQLNSTGTGAWKLPNGTTAQRPATPVVGMERYNSTLDQFEGYVSTGWQPITSLLYSINYLTVAGGGGGGGLGGGGGAGGLLAATGAVNSGTSYSVTVGAGGAGGANSNTIAGIGVSGSNSVIAGIATAIGGGGGGVGGGATNGTGVSGGSGGGSGTGHLTVYAGAAGTSGQGNAGGANYNNVPTYGGGGGGGASAVGAAGTSSKAGDGGAGSSSSISGSAVTYAGGGGSGAYNGTTIGSGGAGGGGNGSNTTTGVAGSANTGGGGGGGSYTPNAAGGAGGSGIVIISYAGAQRGTGGTVTSSGGYTIHTFTSSSTFTA